MTFNQDRNLANASPIATNMAEQTASKDSSSYLSDLIPKDTVFAFGYEPRWLEQEQSFSDYWTQIQKFTQDLKSNVAKRSATWTAEEQQAWQTLSSLPLPQTEAELAELGMSSKSAFWLYGLGLIPALVVEIKQPEKLRAWAKLHLQARDHGFKLVQHHQGAYWRREMKRWVLLIRLKAQRLHVSLLPKKSEPVLLSYFLKERQKVSLSSELKKYFKALPQGRGSGLIKINNLIDMFFGSQVPLLQQSGKALGLPVPMFSSCEQDFRRFADHFRLLSFGLHEVTAQNLSILTHIHLEPNLHASLSSSFQNLKPIYIPKRSTDFGAFAFRLNMLPFISYLSDLGQSWQKQPWTCPLFSSFNEWPKQIQKPEFSILSGLVGQLQGFSLMMYKNKKTLTSPKHSAPKSKNTVSQSDKNFDLWGEVLHPAPQFLLNTLLTLLKGPKLPPAFFELDGQLKDISSLKPELSETYLSLTQQKLMFSLGSWGQRKHLEMIELNKKMTDKTLPTTKRPFLHFSLPPAFSAWLEDKLKMYQKQPKAKVKSKPLLTSSDQTFRAFELYFTEMGILLKVHVDLANKL